MRLLIGRAMVLNAGSTVRRTTVFLGGINLESVEALALACIVINEMSPPTSSKAFVMELRRSSIADTI